MTKRHGTGLDRPIVDFIDTSVLVEILNVPGKAQRRDAVLAELRVREEAAIRFVLPTATIIETGNHVFQVKSGDARRKCAENYVTLLRMTADGDAPWVLHERTWSGALLHKLCDGGSTGTDLVTHAIASQLGAGDLSIVIERDLYAQNVDADVRIWTLETCMHAWAMPAQRSEPAVNRTARQ